MIAKAIMPGKDPGGFIITILLGIPARRRRVVGRLLGIGAKEREETRVSCHTAFLHRGALIVMAIYRSLQEELRQELVR